jgi:hypothetical protein
MHPSVVAFAVASVLSHGLAGGAGAGPAAGVAARSASASARLAVAGAAATPASATAEQPGARFSAAVRSRLLGGWHVRDVAVDEPDSDRDDARGRVELLVASGTEAERHLLDFRGAAPSGYRVVRVAPPAEQRIYPGEAELAATLDAPVTALSNECGVPVLHAGDDAVEIDADDSYVVERIATGAAAATLVADTLASSLLREVEDLSPIDAGGLTALRFHLDDGQPRDLRVELGAGGTVQRAEVRRVRLEFRDRYYARDAALRKALRTGGGVARIVPHGKAGDRFELVFAGGARYLVADGDFAWEPEAENDEEFACSC